MSDKTLDQLIASLKTEAIEVAEKESKKILDEANLKAKKILESSEETRTAMLKDAEHDAQAIINKGKSALQQAARDYSVSVRNDLLKLLTAVFQKEVSGTFNSDLTKTAVIKVIENIGSNVEIKLPKELVKDLADHIKNQLQKSEGVVSIIEDKALLAGFSITKSEQGWSYIISPEEITEALKPYLTDYWINILKNEETA